MLPILFALICMASLIYRSAFKVNQQIDYMQHTIKIFMNGRVPVWTRLVEHTNTEGKKHQKWAMYAYYYNSKGIEVFNIMLFVAESREFKIYQTEKAQFKIIDNDTNDEIKTYRTEDVQTGYERDWGRSFRFSLSRIGFNQLLQSNNRTFFIADYDCKDEEPHELPNDVGRHILRYLRRLNSLVRFYKCKIERVTGCIIEDI